MKLILTLFISLSFSFANAKAKKSYQIFTKNGKAVDFDKVVKEVSTKKYVFFGEYHDNAISHWLEFELTKELHAIHRKRFVIGAEMFEADNQFIIDEYLHNLISSKNFHDEVRLWSNYNTDYKPLIEYAKAYHIKFIATNIPRRYASMVYKKDISSLDSLSELAKSYIVPLTNFQFDSTASCYKNLIQSIEGHGGMAIAKAQAIKDATMAHFIIKNTGKKEFFLHYNGAYHSDNYEGIVYYLKKQVDPKNIATISTVEQKDISKLESKNKSIADFIICVPNTMTKTH